MQLPETGAFGGGQWLVEGRGVEPDVEVDNPPWATYGGEDAQLVAAVSYLLGKVEEDPLPSLQPPLYPSRV